MTEIELSEELEKQSWTFAKSYPTLPHWYIVRQKMDEQLFVDMVIKIRELGVEEKFWKKSYIYFYSNGYKYWTMGNPVNETTIINKAKV